MLRALKNCGVICRVLCLTKGEAYENEIIELGVPVKWIGKAQNPIFRLLKIIRFLRKDPVNIIQSSHFFTNIYAGAAGKILGIPSIGAIRSDLFSEMKMHGFWGKWQVFLPTFLIANSKLAYERAIEKGVSPKRIEFVPNVVSSEAVGQKNGSRGNSSVNLLFVGRLDKNKRPERFVKLAAVLKEKFPSDSLQFQIAGDGVLREELEGMAKNLRLSTRYLEFLGVCNEMNKIYGQSDILISTSEREGTSNVILEAMSHGIPVIATNIGGTPDILNESRGILIEPGDEKQLLESATKLILDEDLRKRLGSEGKRYVKNNHSIESLQKQLGSIYEKLIAEFEAN